MNPKTEEQRTKTEKKKPEFSRIVEQLQKETHKHNWNTRDRRKKARNNKIFDTIITKNFSKLMLGTKPQM